jgi:hypothetical protein
MDVVFVAGIIGASIFLALAGARMILQSVFCLMKQPMPLSRVATREQHSSMPIAA